MTVFEQTLQSITDETTRLRSLLDADPTRNDAGDLERQIQTQCHCRDFVEHALKCEMTALQVAAAAEEAIKQGRISKSHPDLNAEAKEAIQEHSQRIRSALETLEERIE
jgi:hypothetical protein